MDPKRKNQRTISVIMDLKTPSNVDTMMLEVKSSHNCQWLCIMEGDKICMKCILYDNYATRRHWVLDVLN